MSRAGDGGRGGNGGQGANGGAGGQGGSGGSGGVGLDLTGTSVDLTVRTGAAVIGGSGGTGGAGGRGGAGGAGGAGGSGGFSNYNGLGGHGAGGDGGNGGGGGSGGAGGVGQSGGVGGEGIVSRQAGNRIAIEAGAVVTGGSGGGTGVGGIGGSGGDQGSRGGPGGHADGGPAGSDGAFGAYGGYGLDGGAGSAAQGGTGLLITGAGNRVENAGTVTGGAGNNTAPDHGNAIRVTGADSIIINSGTLSAGSPFSTAVRYEAGATGARFDHRNGSTVNGLVDARATTGAALVLGNGDAAHANGQFDLGLLSTQFLGFTSLHKTGVGTSLTLGATTDSTAPWTIEDGSLVITDDAQLGAGGAALTFSNTGSGTGRLDVRQSTTSSRGIALQGPGEVAVGSTAVYQANGVISGAGTLNKSGAGTLVLGAANTATGATTVSGGTLALSGAGSLAASQAVSLHAGTTLDISDAADSAWLNHLSGAAGSRLTLGNQSASLNNGTGTDTEFAGVISGTGDVNKHGVARLTLSGNNDYTGATRVAEGTLALSGAGAIASSNTVDVQSGGVLDIGATAAGATVNNLTGAAGGRVVLGTQSLTANSSTDTTFGGQVEGDGGLVKTGPAALALAGSNSYTGATRVDGGTLALTGAGTIASSHAVAVQGGATLDISATTAGATINNLSGAAGSRVALGTQALTANSSTNTTFGGNIEGSGDLVKSGARTLSLTGQNSLTGATRIEGGTLALSGAGAIASSRTVDVQAGATLDIGATAAGATVNDLRGAATSRVVLGARALTANNNADTTFGGRIEGGGGLVKTGPATLALAGPNSYTGATRVDGGTLALTGDGSIAPSAAVDLRAGTAFDISATRSGAVVNNLGSAASSVVQLGAKALAVQNDRDTVVAGTVVGDGSLTKRGAAQLALAGANTYRGATLISEGRLALQGNGSIAASSAVHQQADTQFDISAINAAGTSVNNLSGAEGSRVELGERRLAINSTTDTVHAGRITGAGGLTKDGAAELVLSGPLEQTGDTWLNAGTLVLDGAQGGARWVGNVVGQSGSHFVLRNGATLTGWIDPTDVTIGSGSTWTMTGNSLVDNLTNNGLLTIPSFSGATPKTLVAQGDVSGNGRIVMNAELGGSSPAHDQIVVHGRVSGQQAITVRNVGGHGSLTPIPLVKVAEGGSIDPGAITLANPGARVSAGVFDYYLQQDATSGQAGDQVLTPVVNPVNTAGLAAVANGAYSLGAMSLPAAGDLMSGGTGSGSAGGGSGSDQSGGRDRAAARGSVLWAKALYGESRNDLQPSVGSRDIARGLQIGRDLYANGNSRGALTRAGAYVALGNGNTWSRDSERAGGMGNLGGGDQEAYSVGLYGLGRSAGGSYVAGVLQASRYTVTNHMLGGFSLKARGSGYVGSVEVGHELPIAAGVKLTPQVQVVGQSTRIGDARYEGAHVAYEDARSVTARLGLKLSTSQKLKNGGQGQGWVTLSGYNTSGNRPKASYSSDQSISTVSEVKAAGKTVGVQTGFAVDLNRNLSGGLQLDHRQGVGDSPLKRNTTLQATIQYRF